MEKGTGLQLRTNPTCRSFREENTEDYCKLIENNCQVYGIDRGGTLAICRFRLRKEGSMISQANSHCACYDPANARLCSASSADSALACRGS